MRQLAVLTFTFALALAMPNVARATRPTPHELIDQALRPVHDQLTQLRATEAERRDVADIIARGETIASELVEAQLHSETDHARSLTHHIELLARTIRGRVEAGRAEIQATEAERIALETEARRVQARASLERAAERRLELERAPAPAPTAPTTPTPATAATPATTATTTTTPGPRAASPATPAHAPRRGHR